MNAGNWLSKRSAISPHREAILFYDRVSTYGELNKRVNRLCHAIAKTGFSVGDRVGVVSRNCPQFLEVYFACAKGGWIFVPMNFRLAAPELAYQISDSGPAMLFMSSELESLVKNSENFLKGGSPMCISWGGKGECGFRDYEDFILQTPDMEFQITPSMGWESPQVIMYTSGTTGTPKGALLPYRKTFFNTLNAVIYFDLHSNDVMLTVLPLFHSGGLNIMTVPAIYAGGKVILRDRFDPCEFLSLVQKHRVTKAMIVPTMLNTILRETRPEDFDLASLRSVLVGGEPASADLIREARARGLPARQIFGQTETSIALWVPPEMADEKAGSVGIPVFHGEVRIVDANGAPVLPGRTGEILVGGPIRMSSYWNMPDETRQTLRDGWLHTGDLATVDEDGYAYVVDRIGDMFISGGENVYPAEVEKVLLQHPRVYEAAVVGVPDNRWGKAGKAFLRLRKGAAMTREEMVSYLRERIASYKIPKHIQVVEELPKTASGKIKKSELLAQKN
ncbi:MAG: long-chain-fatty-acid--CoA ligase [Desulfobacteraceae bacterium]|jgi:fatty-acyl-CoA synthase|nr:MAG: long-chain-fatty-acid--CoA ligase [Desulfobacteraceae bacterium]